MKRLLLMIIPLFIALNLSGQVGLKGGINLSYILGDTEVVTQKSTKAGFQFALMYRYFFEDERIAIQPEIKYIRKGAKFNLEGFKANGQLDYLEIPILGSFSLMEGAINIHIGPQFGYLVDARYEIKDEGLNETVVLTDTDLFNKLDLGLGVGIGFNLDEFYVEFRKNIGFISIDKEIIVNDQQLEPKAKNYNFEFSAGRFF